MSLRRIEVQRIYDDRSGDGVRVLVDRIWPRGISKDKAALDEWCKDAAPSTELRKWYGHDPDRFAEFRRRYRAELGDGDHREAVQHLRSRARSEPLVLLTATKDVEISGATVLAEYLRKPG